MSITLPSFPKAYFNPFPVPQQSVFGSQAATLLFSNINAFPAPSSAFTFNSFKRFPPAQVLHSPQSAFALFKDLHPTNLKNSAPTPNYQQQIPAAQNQITSPEAAPTDQVTNPAASESKSTQNKNHYSKIKKPNSIPELESQILKCVDCSKEQLFIQGGYRSFRYKKKRSGNLREVICNSCIQNKKVKIQTCSKCKETKLSKFLYCIPYNKTSPIECQSCHSKKK